MSSNLLIVEKDDEAEVDITDKELVELLVKDDAKIAYQFFQDDLKEIARYSTVVKVPKGPDVEGLIITFEKDQAKLVRKGIDKLKGKVRQLPATQLDIPFGKTYNISKIQAKFKGRDDILLIHDPDKVIIVGRSQGIVDEAACKFKVRTGFTVDNSSDGVRSNQACKSSCTPNVNKSSGHGWSSASERGSCYALMGQGSSDSKAGKLSGSSGRSYSHPSSSEKFNFEITLKNGFVLKVYDELITNVDVDVIVNAANNTMMHGGGVARVISEAAGWRLAKESRDYVDKNGPLSVTENIVTTAGNLHQYKAVIHAVGPEWNMYKDKVLCLGDLFVCIYNILATCTEKKFRTVGMSAISAGACGVPKELCANIYVYAAAKFSGCLSASECPRELHVVDIDTNILKLVEESSKRWEKNPESLNPRVCVPEFFDKNPKATFSSIGPRSWDLYGGRNAQYGAKEWKEAREIDVDDATFAGDIVSSVDPDYMDKHHDSGGWWREAEGKSGLRIKSGSTLKLYSILQKLQDERFKWGATANLFLLNRKVTVKIYQGAIDRIKDMDAIVCGTDESLQQHGYLADALLKAGGNKYTDACKEMSKRHAKYAKPGDVFKCKAGNLGAKWVLQAVCKRISDANDEETNAYKRCIENILKKANRNDIKKIALPLVATGKIQTQKDKLKKCGTALLKALDVYLEDCGSKNDITEVHLINDNQFVSAVLVEVFDKAAASDGEKKSYPKSPGFQGQDVMPVERGLDKEQEERERMYVVNERRNVGITDDGYEALMSDEYRETGETDGD